MNNRELALFLAIAAFITGPLFAQSSATGQKTGSDLPRQSPNPAQSAAGMTTDQIDAHLATIERNRVACGPNSLWFCLRQLGREHDRLALIAQAPIEENGIDLQSLLRLSETAGLPAFVTDVASRSLEDIPLPAILVVGAHHCVAFAGFTPDGKAQIFEPSQLAFRTIEPDALLRNWNGVAVVFAEPPMSVGSSILVGIFTAALTSAIVIACAILPRRSLAPAPVVSSFQPS